MHSHGFFSKFETTQAPIDDQVNRDKLKILPNVAFAVLTFSQTSPWVDLPARCGNRMYIYQYVLRMLYVVCTIFLQLFCAIETSCTVSSLYYYCCVDLLRQLSWTSATRLSRRPAPCKRVVYIVPVLMYIGIKLNHTACPAENVPYHLHARNYVW